MTLLNVKANPSKLLTLKNLYNIGAMTKEEYVKARKEALGINVYKQNI